ncbi:hypothetical protein HK405_010010 [Cladochytrium tenue]|nr:hypothetical protein HK405_010010 [Cladochytrium tenue]
MRLPGILFGDKDIRFNYELAGGALMDLSHVVSASRYIAEQAAVGQARRREGAPAVDEDADARLVRLLATTVPEVERATAKLLGKDARIDAAMTAELVYRASGVRSTVTGALRDGLFSMEFSVVLEGEGGKVRVNNFAVPNYYHTVKFERTDGRVLTRTVYGEEKQTTYWYQMKAFLEAIKTDGKSLPASGLPTIEDTIANMETIDAIYRKAGMPTR